MSTRYVLIDYENVQPDVLDRLDPKQFAIFVFVGANQAKMSTGLVTAMQRFVKGFRCIQVSGSGRNALDFHLAYYLGRIAAREPDANFYVVSADTGYDPLISHLEGERVTVRRVSSLAEITGKRPTKSKSSVAIAPVATDRLAQIVDDLKRRGESRPRSIKALRATINALFHNGLAEQDLAGLIERLVKHGTVIPQGTKVSYRFPV